MIRRVLLLTLALVLAGCTNSKGPDLDQDNDGVEDAVETEGRIIEIQLLNGTERRQVTGDPSVADTDGDGVLDGEEMLVRGSDPRDVDTDDDGLLDGKDRSAPDDATAKRWLAQGILRVDDLFLGELSACPEGGPQLRPNQASSDLPLPDELSDGEELRGWDVNIRGTLRHVTSDPCHADTDRDGLADHFEKVLLADPRDADTDQDGVPDGSDGDPVADLALEFTDLRVTTANATSVRIVILLGNGAVELRWPGNASAVLDVPDQSASRETLEARMVLSAEDGATGDPLALTSDPRGAILSLDLLTGAASGTDVEGDTLHFSGRDGSMTLRWSTLRR